MKRARTGIEGLDQLTGGGLPSETVTLISGPAGSGKSLLCLQFACQGAVVEKEKALYLTLEESAGSIARALSGYSFASSRPHQDGRLVMVDLGWLRRELEGPDRAWGRAGLERLHEEGRAHLVSTDWMIEEERAEEELASGVVGFRVLEAALEHLTRDRSYGRLVIDSLAAVGLHHSDPGELRRELLSFGRFLRDRKATTLVITETVPPAQTRYGVEHFLCDAHIALGLRTVRGEAQRTITVQKMKYTGHDAGVHPFAMTEHGMVVNAREYIRT